MGDSVPLKSVLLCYEDREKWKSASNIPQAEEAARWLAPTAEMTQAIKLVEQAGFDPILCELSESAKRINDKIAQQCGQTIIWNISDGLEPFRGSLIPALAVLWRIPYLGSSTYVQGICQNKHHWRSLLKDRGISCLPGHLFRTEEQATQESLIDLSLPIFVKTARYGNNAGFNIAPPLANSYSDAVSSIQLLLRGGLGPVLAEEFASGQEYSVWCFQTDKWHCFQFSKDMDVPFISSDIKDKKPFSGKYQLVRTNDDNVDELCVSIIDELQIEDYVRFDIRKDDKGNLFPIDINTGAFFTGRTFERAGTEMYGDPHSLLRNVL